MKPGRTDQKMLQVSHQALLDSLNIGFALMDMDDTILEANETLLKMAGVDREGIVGKKAFEFYDRQEYEHMRRIGFSRSKNEFYQFESFLRTSDGGTIPVVFNSSINKNEDGTPVSFNILLTDIREQKKIQAELEAANLALQASRDTLQKEKKMLEAILFGIGDCVTIFDRNRNILLSNPKGMEIRGGRRTPLLPLIPGLEREINIQTPSGLKQFTGRVEPIRDPNGEVHTFAEILKDVSHLFQLEQTEKELFRIKREMRRNALETEMVGSSPAMKKVFDLILRCSEVDSAILVLGETGVGKELAARAIHAQSARKNRPFIAVNCGALPESLLESELFGHVKGAFTGAISERPGLFREADGGTLFLDEIGDLSLPLQIKLLRALQEKEIRPVGGGTSYSVDVRLITATNRDLKSLVHQGRFRDDLYYRIAVIPVVVPPLRERVEDIIPLAEHFIRKHRKTRTRPLPSLDRDARQKLLDYTWPGNIRELENGIEHALAMAGGPVISSNELPVHLVSRPLTGTDDLRSNREFHSTGEKEAIRSALARHKGNRTRAAAELGISRTTLWRKITMFGLDHP